MARLVMVSDLQREVSEQLTCSEAYASESCERRFAGTAQELRRLLVTAGWWESRYGLRFHANDCKPNECDGGKAVGLYQIHDQLFFPDGLWESAKGLSRDATYSATLGAGLAFSQAWSACKSKHGIRGVWSAYGRGNCTQHYPTLGGRVQWFFDLHWMS